MYTFTILYMISSIALMLQPDTIHRHIAEYDMI